MPTFKPKTNKKIKICKKYTVTLDGKHTEFLNQFSKEETEIIPSLKEERRALRQLLRRKNLKIETVMETKDRIVEISNTIKEIKNKKNDYFLSNSKYIFDYFENKKNIDNVEENSVPSSSMKTQKNQILFNIFKVKKEETERENEEVQCNNIVQQYLNNIDETIFDMDQYVKSSDVCENCGRGEMIPVDDEGVMVCNNCAVNVPYLVENEKQSYKEPPKEVCFYAYKKINHFKEILAQFQGKETTQVDEEILEQIRQQIKKERINMQELTHYKTKEMLKKLGFNKYYEHIAFIKNKLGIRPPVLSPELEETLCNLFMEIQAPYAKVCPDYRVNFLNYYYVLYKFLELLGETCYLKDIPMLKDREKIIEQDETWKQMCIILDWEFIPTL